MASIWASTPLVIMLIIVWQINKLKLLPTDDLKEEFLEKYKYTVHMKYLAEFIPKV